MPLSLKKQKKNQIQRNNLDQNAVSIVRRLSRAGFTAYLVGGCVRDILLDRTPKDFDIATDASPRQIRKLFRNAFIIGRRFKLALIRFGNKHIEVSTFRRSPLPDDDADNDKIGALYVYKDNLFGTPEEDAKRRDFTVNALFYDINASKIIDYTGGMRDLEKKLLRSIGDPNVRFREDPVRMLRAVLLSARLGFTIHSESTKAITRYRSEINQASKPRLFEEIMRLFTYNKSEEAFRLLWSTKLMNELLPEVDSFINHTGKKKSVFWNYLCALDSVELEEDEPNSPINNTSLRLATLLAPLFLYEISRKDIQELKNAEEISENLVDTVIVHPYSSGSWRIPRQICKDTSVLLASLLFYRDENIRQERYYRRHWFNTALYMWKIHAMATDDKSASDLIQSWEDGYNSYSEKVKTKRQGKDHPTKKRRKSNLKSGREDVKGDDNNGEDNAKYSRRRRRRK
jgi:poly(A) polymerase